MMVVKGDKNKKQEIRNRKQGRDKDQEKRSKISYTKNTPEG
jgi:hypothetical protein